MQRYVMYSRDFFSEGRRAEHSRPEMLKHQEEIETLTHVVTC